MTIVKKIETFIIGLIAATLALSTPAMAKAKRHRGTNSGTGTRKPVPVKPPPPKVSPADQKAIDLAALKVQKDQAALNTITVKLRAQFETSSDFVSASTEAKRTEDAYLVESRRVLSSLDSNPDYQHALADKAVASAKVDSLRADPGSSPDQIAPAATGALESAMKVTKIENDAINADPHIATLKADATAGADKVARLRKAFESSLTSEPAWSAAKSNLDQAEAALENARRKLSV